MSFACILWFLTLNRCGISLCVNASVSGSSYMFLVLFILAFFFFCSFAYFVLFRFVFIIYYYIIYLSIFRRLVSNKREQERVCI